MVINIAKPQISDWKKSLKRRQFAKIYLSRIFKQEDHHFFEED